MKRYQLFMLLLSIIIIEGCGSNMSRNYIDVAQKVSEAESDVSKITVGELQKILEHKGEYKIIDCRETDEFIEGHIPGAINIPRGLLEFSDKISNRRETIYVYSQTNDRATLACSALKLFKYNKVFLIDGGWLEWINIFPDQIEEGDSETAKTTAPIVKESSGCGG